MTHELPFGKRVRSIATAAVLAGALSIPMAHAQESQAKDPAPSASAKAAEIDAFLANLDQNVAGARPVAVKPAPTPTDPVAQLSASEEIVPLQVDTGPSPVSTLLLMIGGILLCALATVGLTLVFFALRRDIKRRQRGHRRRTHHSSHDSAIQPVHR